MQTGALPSYVLQRVWPTDRTTCTYNSDGTVDWDEFTSFMFLSVTTHTHTITSTPGRNSRYSNNPYHHQSNEAHTTAEYIPRLYARALPKSQALKASARGAVDDRRGGDTGGRFGDAAADSGPSTDDTLRDLEGVFADMGLGKERLGALVAAERAAHGEVVVMDSVDEAAAQRDLESSVSAQLSTMRKGEAAHAHMHSPTQLALTCVWCYHHTLSRL